MGKPIGTALIPTSDSAQCRIFIPSSNRSGLTPGTPEKNVIQQEFTNIIKNFKLQFLGGQKSETLQCTPI